MSLADLFRQLSILIGLPAVLLACAGAATIVVARDWRLGLFGYALVSLMLALLLSQIIPTDWALMQAITGGLIAVILFLSARQLRWTPDSGQPWERRWPNLASLTSFRLLALVLAAVSFAVVRGRIAIPGLDPLFRDALLWLLMMSLLGLCLHSEPLHAGLSLLVFARRGRAAPVHPFPAPDAGGLMDGRTGASGPGHRLPGGGARPRRARAR